MQPRLVTRNVNRRHHPVTLAPISFQEASADSVAIPCGHCASGMIIAAKALLEHHPKPSKDEIRAATSGNRCRGDGYEQIVQAIQMAAGNGGDGR